MIKSKTQRIHLSQAAAAPTKAAARQLVSFAVGLLCARGVVFGQYAPFAVAAAAAMPYSMLWSVVVGGVVGYLLPSAVSVPVHYIAAILAAAAIRWTLSDLAKMHSHPLFAPITAFLPLLSTDIAVVTVSGAASSSVAMYISESLLGAGTAYFIARTVSSVEAGRSVGEWDAQELASGAFSAGILLLAFSGLAIGGISAGRVLAVIAILFAARYGGVAGGSVAGITAGIIFSLSTSGLNYLSGAYALGGLTAGLFSPLGRLASAGAFVVANGIASLQVGSQVTVINGMYEVMAATVIYMVIPARVGSQLVGMFSHTEDSNRAEGLRRSVVMRLDYAAKALGSVSESVEEVSRKLSTTCAPDINGVFQKTVDEVCGGCGLKIYCWDRGFAGSMDALNNLTDKLRKEGRVSRADFGEPLAGHCSRLNQLAESLNRHYGEFIIKDSAENRAQQVRSVVADQFTTTSRMLEDLAGELELYEQFDFTAAKKVQEALRLKSIMPIETSCRTDRYGRMSVEIVASPADCSGLNRAELAQTVSRACGHTLDMPCISSAGRVCRIQMSEMPTHRIKSGCAQHNSCNGKFCGDSWKCFPDGNGRQIALISDGMGTGGRAAVDGAMACGIMERMIRAGIGFDAALKIVNSALIVKSGDESLATMDLAAVDMFTGNAEFMKAGAPVSILRKSGHAIVIDAPSLPIGILNDTRFAKTSEELEEGDLLVMLSDGALSSGGDWVCDEIENWQGRLPQELAEIIVSKAISRRSDGHDDDITVLVLMVCPKD